MIKCSDSSEKVAGFFLSFDLSFLDSGVDFHSVSWLFWAQIKITEDF